MSNQEWNNSPNVKLDAPCLGCKERYVLCHSECQTYKEWKVKLDNKREEIQLKKYQEGLVYKHNRNATTLF